MNDGNYVCDICESQIPRGEGYLIFKHSDPIARVCSDERCSDAAVSRAGGQVVG